MDTGERLVRMKHVQRLLDERWCQDKKGTSGLVSLTRECQLFKVLFINLDRQSLSQHKFFSAYLNRWVTNFRWVVLFLYRKDDKEEYVLAWLIHWLM